MYAWNRPPWIVNNGTLAESRAAEALRPDGQADTFGMNVPNQVFHRWPRLYFYTKIHQYPILSLANVIITYGSTVPPCPPKIAVLQVLTKVS